MTAQPPDPSSRVIDPAGRIDPVWNRFFRQLWRQGKDLVSDAAGLETAKASVSQPWAASILIEVPTDKTYSFPRAGLEGTIDEITVVTTAGTCTVTLSIGGFDVGGGLAASTTQATYVYVTDNTLGNEDDIALTISSASSPENLSVTLRGTRTMEA